MTYSVRHIRDIDKYEMWLMDTAIKCFKEYGHAGGPNNTIPDPQIYKQLNTSKMGGIIMAFDEDETPVGFMSFFVSGHMHYMGKLFGVTDATFIEKEHRSLGLYRHLLRVAETTLRHAFNAEYYVVTVNTSNPIGKVLERKGYEMCDVSYSKKLGE